MLLSRTRITRRGQQKRVSNTKFHIIYIAIIAVLGVLFLWLLGTDSRQPEVITERHTDTLTIVKHDTTTITKVITKVEKTPADTVYITIRDSVFIPVPRQEYTFSEPDLFDFRVKGYMVDFVDAKVYPKTIYQTITNESTTTITKYRSSLFVNAGFSAISGNFYPKVGVALSLKGKWLISGDFTLYQKKALVSGTIGYNILQK